MADDKMQTVLEEVRGRRTPWMGMSVFFLSILLSATVATVIYMSVNRPVGCLEHSVTRAEDTKPDVSARVNINVDDKQVKEKIEYSKKRDIAFLYGDDGAFTAEDYGKGLDIVKPADSSSCYVIVTGTNRTSDKQQTALAISLYEGQEFSPEVKEETFQLLPGYITDRSFFPEEANTQCATYQWLVMVDKDENESDEEGSSRKKRSFRCAYLCITYRRTFFRRTAASIRARHACIRCFSYFI